MRVVVAGASGLIGRALAAALARRGDEVVRLVRREPGAGEAHWDPTAGTVDRAALDGAGALVDLAGAGIGDRRWSPARKEVVVASRVAATTVLVRAIADLEQPPGTLVNASAVGFYGDRGDEVLTEDSAPGSGFLADLCQRWEAAALAAEASGTRVVCLRSGVVLARHGGALARLVRLVRLGVGGRLGSGRQWVSWISLDDEVGAILHLLSATSIAGPVNLTAPSPVPNAALTRSIARAVHRPAFLAVPSFALKIAVGRELAAEVLLASQRALPHRLTDSGYQFRHPTLDQALAAILSSPAPDGPADAGA